LPFITSSKGSKACTTGILLSWSPVSDIHTVPKVGNPYPVAALERLRPSLWHGCHPGKPHQRSYKPTVHSATDPIQGSHVIHRPLNTRFAMHYCKGSAIDFVDWH
jgi:hypothetical protein